MVGLLVPVVDCRLDDIHMVSYVAPDTAFLAFRTISFGPGVGTVGRSSPHCENPSSG